MIVKILIHGQEDLGKFYIALSSSDNRPELGKDKCLFDASYKQMAMLVQDTKQKTEIDGEWDYTLTLDVAEFIGEMSSDGDLGPDLNTFEPVPGEWILKIFNAIGRYPLEAEEDKLPERTGSINPNYIPEPPFPIHAELAQLLRELQVSSTDTLLRKVVWWIQGVTSYDNFPDDLKSWLNAKGNDLMAETAEESPAALETVGKIVEMFRNREMPADESYLVLSKDEVSELLNLDKRMVVDVMFWLERIHAIDPTDDSEVTLDHKRHFTERGQALIRLITGVSSSASHVVSLIEKAIDTHLTVNGKRV